MPTHPNPIRQDLIDPSQYEILDYGFCLNNPNEIASWCARWQNFEFSARQRIVFVNDDVDFYINASSAGFSNYNFFKCCQYFNIATDHVLYVTTHIGIHKEIWNLCNLLNLPYPTVIETHNFSRMMPCHGIRDVDHNEHLIDRPYVFAAGIQRHHRVMMLTYLKQENLFDKGHISYHFDYSDTHQSTKQSLGPDRKPTLRTTLPWQGVNEEFAMSQQDHMVWSQHAADFVGQRRVLDFEGSNFDKAKAIREHQPAFVQRGLVNLVSETYFDFPYPALSEKTFKPIWSKRAFIILGAKNSLRTVRELGFQTFHDCWDESYDQEPDPMTRLKKIVFLIKILCAMDQSQIQDLTDRVRHITQYNYQHYMNFHVHNSTSNWY